MGESSPLPSGRPYTILVQGTQVRLHMLLDTIFYNL